MNTTSKLSLMVASTLMSVACTAGQAGTTSEEPYTSDPDSVTYTSDDGCTVTVEPRARQVMVMVSKGNAQAIFGYSPDLTTSDIAAFCPEAQATQDGDTVTIACDEQNKDSIPTRGKVTMELGGPLSDIMTGSLKGLEVRGERQSWYTWKTDTDFACKELRLAE